MTSVGKRFTTFTNIYKMSNACASSSCRYKKSLNEWYTMYVKNFNFLFKSMFLRKNGQTEKEIKLNFSSSLRKTSPHFIKQTPPRTSTIVQPPSMYLKRGRHRKRSIVLYPELFYTYWCIFLLCIIEWKWRTPTMVRLMLETFLEITITRLQKMNFPARQLFLKTLHQKYWSQCLGNYTDHADGTYNYLSNYTDGTKWDCIHKYQTKKTNNSGIFRCIYLSSLST